MSKTKEEQSVFATLNGINVNGHTEKKKTGNSTELTYLSWPWAWAEVMKRYPDASYKVYRDENNRPYFEDEDYGLMCYTSVTIEEKTFDMWLPVMNGANKAMRRKPYSYQVWNNYKKAYEEKTVEAATMFDINKTIMRCLVKNLAMFGLGLYIYAGEDLPEEKDAEQQPEQKQAVKKTAAKPAQQPTQQAMFDDSSQDALHEAFMLIKQNIETAPSRAYLNDLHEKNKELHDYEPYRTAMNKRFKEVS